ncbi:MAG: serine hydrolase [Erythrobacter sp.]
MTPPNELFAAVILAVCAATGPANAAEPRQVAETEASVASDLAALDATLFKAAFVDCDMPVVQALLAEDLEFYHDRDGLSYTSASGFVADVSRGCATGSAGGKRVLVPGSMTTHMIGDFGAMQIGRHEFHEVFPDDSSIARERGEFMHMWQRSPTSQFGWQITRIISYDHEGAEPANAAVSDQAVLRRTLAEQLPGWLATYDVPSASIAYIENGEIAWTFAAGEAEPGMAATPDTLYNIASMTKPLVAETVVRLAADGAISLDESMAGAWVDPDLRDDPRHALLTPRMALTHRTGLPNWRYQTGDVLAFQHDPDTQFGYSGEGMQYVARFVEAKLDTPLEELVQRMVLIPSGMAETTFTDQSWLDGRIAMSRDGSGEWGYAPRRETWNAADDVWSSAADYARFMVWVMTHPVSDASPQDYWLPQENLAGNICGEGRLAPDVCPKSLGFVSGWSIYVTADHTIVMHGGADDGERTLGFFDPVSGTGAVIFTNGANGQKVIRDTVKMLFPDPSFAAFMVLQAGG